MATQSSSSSADVSSTDTPTIVEVFETTRNKNVWCNFNLVKLSDETVKAHCKHCGKFLKHESNSTLKMHTDKYCEGLKSVPEAGQASMSREGGIFAYEAKGCREQFASFVIQEVAISLFNEEIALDEAASKARSSEAEEEYLTLEKALN
ncbi:hypothetical protein Tco_1390405 [Tanacetum coccineum]